MVQTNRSAATSSAHQLQLAFRLPHRDRLKRIALSKPRRNDIFIAYDPIDGTFVRPLDQALRQQGFDPWIDYDDILIGSSYEEQLRTGVRDADVFVLVLTEHTFNQPEISECLKLALDLNKLILVTARANISRPMLELSSLGSVEWLCVEASSSEDIFDQLALNIIHIQTYVRLLARTINWRRHGQRRRHLLSEEDLDAVLARKQWIESHQLKMFFSFDEVQPFLSASAEHVKALKQQKLAQRTQPEIFISYSRRDREFIKDLTDALVRHQWKVWIDWENIPVATDWREQVDEGVREAHTFLFVVSAHSVLSEHCQWELMIAKQYNKRVIPVIIDNDYDRNRLRRLGLSSIQYVSYVRQEAETAFGELLGALKLNLSDAKTYTRLFNKAHDWAEHGRPDHTLLSSQELREVNHWCQQRQIEDSRDRRVIMPLLPLQEEFIRTSRKHAHSKLRRSLIATTVVGTVITFLSVLLTFATIGEIRALVLSLEENKGLDGLITALKAGKQLQRHNWLVRLAKPNLRPQATTALHSATLELRELNRLKGHRGAVFDLAFSPDGQHIATAGEDLSMRIWDIQHSRSSSPQFSHSKEVVTIDYSADGEFIATGSYDGSVKLWTPSGQLYKTVPKPHNDWVSQVKYSPGGQYLVSTGFDGAVHLWSRQDDFSASIQMDHDLAVGAVDFSPYGRLIVTADAGGTVKLWDRQGRLRQQISYGSTVLSVVFSPDGETVAIAGFGGQVMLWDLQQNRLRTLGRHDDTVHQVAFSDDGLTLATASEDSTVKLWNLLSDSADETLMATLRGHENPVYRVAFSPDDRIVATAGADNVVRLWSRQKGTLLDVLEGHEDEILSIAFAPVVFADENSTQPRSEILASSSKDGDIRLWNINTPIQPLPHENRVFDVAFRPDGQVIASSGVDTIRLWRSDAKLRSHLYAGKSKVLAIDYNPSGELLAAATDTGQLQLWRPEVDTSRPSQSILAHHSAPNSLDQGVLAVQFSPNGRWVISGGADHSVKLWLVEDLLQGKQAPRHTLSTQGVVTSLAISHDGRWLAAGSKAPATATKGTIQVWQLPLNPTGSPSRQLQLQEEDSDYRNDVLSVAINPVTGQIATGGSNNRIQLWSPQGRLLKSLNEHAEAVTKVSFSADGQFLVSASQDGSIRLWTAKGDLISSLSGHSREVSSVEFGPQGGQILASAGFDNTVLLWKLWDLPQQQVQLLTRQIDILSTLLSMGCQSADDYLQNYPVSARTKQTMSQPELEKVREIEEIQGFCQRFSAPGNS